ncbi:MAG TPA: hypothetical protein VIJ85_11460 [Rhizomicrobium sp.]
MSDAAPLSANAGAVKADMPSALPRFVAVVLRYTLSALGPISVSAAHFIAALIFLHSLQRAEFGLFAFVFIIVSFCFSMSGALFGASLVNSVNTVGPMSTDGLAAFMKANAIFSLLAAVAVFALMLAGSATPDVAAIIGLYGGVMTMRWFARSYAYAIHKMPRAITSDVIYSVALVAALGGAAFAHALTPRIAAAIMVFCSLCALVSFGPGFLAAQGRAIFKGSLRDFMPVWQDLARWSLLGVVTTEAASNAHAYLVTFISGPHAFALLAVGALFMRPVSLVMTALPDAERPAMARAIAQNKMPEALRALMEFRLAGLAVLAGTIALATVILIWFPQLVLKNGYDERSIVAVVCIYIAIMAVRVSRTPESVFLQVIGEYKSLSGASVRSSIVSVTATLTLLLIFGPLVSLLGILLGEMVGAQRVFVLVRAWHAKHKT